MSRTLEQAAVEIARQSFLEVTTEPEAYGVEGPWRSIQEWVDFELNGDGPYQLTREFHVNFREAARALTVAMLGLATLEELNTTAENRWE